MTPTGGARDFLDELKDARLASALDLARWLAAAVVALSHARFPLFKGYGFLEPNERPIWVQAWYFATGYFLEAVLVFFVLSGFLVGGMACARLKRRTFDGRSYAIDRFSRLYVGYLPALLLTVILTAIGMYWFNTTGLYQPGDQLPGRDPSIIDVATSTGIVPFIGNLAMLQYYFVESYGSNPPFWTLSNEFWFYVIFGLVATATGARMPASRWGLVAAALVLAAILGLKFWFYLAIWLIGVAAAVVKPPKWRLAPFALLLLAGLLIARRFGDAALGPSEVMSSVLQLLICAAMGLVLLGWRGRPPGWALPLRRANKAMADFSYSLYLTHYPVLILFVAMLGKWTGDRQFLTGFSPVDPYALAIYLCEIALVFVVAWLFAQLTERHTGKLRAWLRRRVPPFRKAGAG